MILRNRSRRAGWRIQRRPAERIAWITLLLAGTLVLPGCAPLIVGGAVVGAATIHDRRPANVVFDDQQI